MVHPERKSSMLILRCLVFATSLLATGNGTISDARVLRPKADIEMEVTQAIGVLRHGDDEARLKALELLKIHSEHARPAISELTAAIEDDSFDIRLGAIRVLEAIGPHAASGTPALGKALDDPVLDVQIASAYALAAIGLADETIFQRLRKAMDDVEPRLRVAAAYSITIIFRENAQRPFISRDLAMPAANILFVEIQEPESWEVIRAALVVATLDEEIASLLVPALVTLSEGNQPTVSANARYALEALGKRHPTLTARQISSLHMASVPDRLFAIRSIGQLRSGEPCVISALVSILAEPEEVLVIAALEALALIGPAAAPAVGTIEKLVYASAGRVRQAASFAIVDIAPEKVDSITSYLDNVDNKLSIEVKKRLLMSML